MKIVLAVVAALILLATGYWLFVTRVGNPWVERELVEHPDGERARRVMLLTLPSGRRIPVNYWRDAKMVFAGADGSWWKEMADGPVTVTLLVRGETLRGTARAVLDDPEYTARIFEELRPNAIKGFGTLVEVRLEGVEDDLGVGDVPRHE